MARLVIRHWNEDAFEQIRKSPEVAADIKRRADNIAAACGAGYESSLQDGETRAHGSVAAISYEAQTENATGNVILSNADVGRT